MKIPFLGVFPEKAQGQLRLQPSMSGSTALVLVLGLFLLAGMFSWAEQVLRTASRSRLKQSAEQGSRSAQKALELTGPKTELWGILRWTSAGLGLAAAGLSTAVCWQPLAETLGTLPWPWPAGWTAKVAFGLLVVGLALAWGLLVETIPHRLAAGLSDRAALWVIRPVEIWSRLVGPVHRLVERLAQPVVFLLRGRRSAPDDLSLEEIEHWVQLGATAGLIAPAEQKVAQRALRFGDRTVRQIMRPRIEIDAIDVDSPPEQVIGIVAMAGFSRLPVYEGDIDHIIGFVYTKDLLRQQHLGWPIELRRLLRPALMVPGSLGVDRLLEMFREKKVQMAIVLDEYGGTEGLVTLEDVLEELVGEIHDEHRPEPQEQMVPLDAHTWLVHGGMNVEDFFDRLGREDLHSPETRSFHTVAGLVLAVLDRIPQVGDRLCWQDLEMEVVQMNGMRIDRVRVKIPESS